MADKLVVDAGLALTALRAMSERDRVGLSGFLAYPFVVAVLERVIEDAVRKGDDSALGATGEFPLGKLSPDDDGELRAAIGVENGSIMIRFGKPTAWIGLTRDDAVRFAETLARHALRMPTT